MQTRCLGIGFYEAMGAAAPLNHSELAGGLTERLFQQNPKGSRCGRQITAT
jgi:hypothetical protein